MRFKLRGVIMILATACLAILSAYVFVLGYRDTDQVQSIRLDSSTGQLPATRNSRPDPVASVVAYFRANGIELEEDAQLSNWWIVARPSAGDFRVSVAFRSFPPSSTEQQMREELLTISLGFILNAPAHVAMSYPGHQGTRPDAVLISPEAEATKKKLIDLFERFKAL